MLHVNPPAERRQIDVNGRSLSVLIAGLGPAHSSSKPSRQPPVLAVHGFGSSGQYTWQSTGHLVALTKADRLVIAPDLLGHGRSDKPQRPEDYSLAGFADDAVAVLDAVLADVNLPATTPVDLLGYSLGARVCWELLGEPGRWRRAVLGGYDGRPLFAGVDVPALLAALADPAGEAALPPATRRIVEIARAVPGNSLPALVAIVTALSGGPVATGERRAPVLLAAGADDPLATSAAEFAARCAGEFVSIPRRDHISAVPAGVFRRAVVDFLTD